LCQLVVASGLHFAFLCQLVVASVTFSGNPICWGMSLHGEVWVHVIVLMEHGWHLIPVYIREAENLCSSTDIVWTLFDRYQPYLSILESFWFYKESKIWNRVCDLKRIVEPKSS
jgi:hypothetical protein